MSVYDRNCIVGRFLPCNKLNRLAQHIFNMAVIVDYFVEISHVPHCFTMLKLHHSLKYIYIYMYCSQWEWTIKPNWTKIHNSQNFRWKSWFGCSQLKSNQQIFEFNQNIRQNEMMRRDAYYEQHFAVAPFYSLWMCMLENKSCQFFLDSMKSNFFDGAIQECSNKMNNTYTLSERQIQFWIFIHVTRFNSLPWICSLVFWFFFSLFLV